MKPAETKCKSGSKLSKSIEHKLNGYALMAGAASVGLLALTQPADAEIVYTPVHHVIHPGQTYLIDINGDGQSDFEFHDANSGSFADLSVRVLEFNKIQSFATPLNRGAVIGSKDVFYGCGTCSSGSLIAGANAGGDFGPWVNVSDRYLGVRLQVQNSKDQYYGWVRMSVRVEGTSVTALVTGYAYENTANTSIRAGQTSGTFQDDAGPEQFPHPKGLGALAKGKAQSSVNWR
jgi:hypothetical protein